MNYLYLFTALSGKYAPPFLAIPKATESVGSLIFILILFCIFDFLVKVENTELIDKIISIYF